MRDEGWPLEIGFTGTDFKPLYAAVVKSYGRERYRKISLELAGNYAKGDRKGTIDEVSKKKMMSKPEALIALG